MIDSKQATSTSATATSPGSRVHPREQAAATRAILPHVRPGQRILDIDAGSGWSTLLLAAQAGPTGHVWAWELDPTLRAELKANTSSAGLADRITVVPDPEDPDTLPPVDMVHLGPDAQVEAWLDGHHGWLRHLEPCLALTVASARIEPTLRAIAASGFVPFQVDGTPVVSARQLSDLGSDTPVLCRSASTLAGHDVWIATDRAALMEHFDLPTTGRLLETDLDVVHNDCERFERKRRDAEVLCSLAASFPGPCLDLGTSHGRSAFKLATNIDERHRVTTVNMLPTDSSQAGAQITHLLTREEIGCFFREAGIGNIDQVYANTLTWEWPAVEDCGYHVAFVDACHDTDAVYCDSLRVWERVAPGGFMVWHDFSPAMRSSYGWIDSVHKGVEMFARSARLRQPIVWLQGSWCGIVRKDGLRKGEA